MLRGGFPIWNTPSWKSLSLCHLLLRKTRRKTELKKQIQELENIDIIYMVRECGLTPEALSGLLAKVQAAPNAAETKEKEDASIET